MVGGGSILDRVICQGEIEVREEFSKMLSPKLYSTRIRLSQILHVILTITGKECDPEPEDDSENNSELFDS